MVTMEHKDHLASNRSHNSCPECRADCERRHAVTSLWIGYRHVHEYLTWAKPRVEAIRNGEDSIDARRWARDFTAALHSRINAKVSQAFGRKHSDGYLERLGQFCQRIPTSDHNSRFRADATYLRVYARRGASTL